ncbi:unnamed protein product [uncultured bacterium]|nr:unnamed protein product [uncultured bacterium]
MIRHTVIVTGATKGLGRAIALAFAEAGHRVLGVYASDDAAAERAEAALRSANSASSVVKYDVARENPDLWSRPEILDAESLVLVNNACAPFTPGPLHLLTWNAFESGLRVGVRGSWECARAVLRPMARQGRGTIVNVLSAAVAGLPPKGFAAYAATKHALRGLTLALAAEYHERGIRVFSVSPGFMATPLTDAWDARLADAARSAGPVSDPVLVAKRVRELVDLPDLPGRGEDYLA